MKTLRDIWRRITFARKAVGRIRSRLKTRYAPEAEATLARTAEKSAWQGGEIERLRAEIVRVRAEYARVREENRALLNSILGIAGIPPIPVALQDAHASEAPNANSAGPPRSDPSAQSGLEAPAPISAADKDHPRVPTAVSGPVSPFTGENANEQKDLAAQPRVQTRRAATRPKNLSQVAAPMRRRSWQQINRTLEFEAARKKTGPDVDALGE